MAVLTRSADTGRTLDLSNRDCTKIDLPREGCGDEWSLAMPTESAGGHQTIACAGEADMEDLPEEMVAALILWVRAARSLPPGSAPPQVPSYLEPTVLEYLAANLPHSYRSMLCPPVDQPCQ